MVDKQLVARITTLVTQELSRQGVLMKNKVPVGISARHIHLEQAHLEVLFGKNYQLTPFKDLSQPNQFACHEKLTLKGPKGDIHNVRILGPLRAKTQVEISRTDGRQLGVNPPVRSSGDLKGAAPITLIGPKGEITVDRCCIIADRHIHMTPKDAKMFNVVDKQKVSVIIPGEKSGVMDQVTIRVNSDYALDMHIDTDDGNAFGLNGNEWLEIIDDEGGRQRC